MASPARTKPPLDRALGLQRARADRSPLACHEGERILVLEDDPDVAESVSRILEDAGFSVTVRTNGVEALLELERNRYSVALLDLDVPDLSGLGVQRALGDVCSVETIAMSGRSGPWKREAIEVGATACLSKPFDADDLLLIVRRLAGKLETSAPWPTDVMELDGDDLERMRALSQTELDALPFGVIQLNAAGVITAYNHYESLSVGRPAHSVIGTRLRDLAPCLMVKEFLDSVEEGYRCRRLDKVLRFLFPIGAGWRAVNLRLYFDQTNEAVWVFVSQRRRST